MESCFNIIDLVLKAQNNDDNAKEILIKANTPLVKSVIKRYIGKGIEYDDLLQLGNLGFLKAINNFKPEFNVKFSTYAVPMISGEIKRYMRDTGILKVSRSVKTLNIQINKFIERYINVHNNSPKIDEIAEEFGVSCHDVVFAMESNQQPVSYNLLVGDDGANKQMMLEKIEGSNIDCDMDMFLIYKIIKGLCDRDRKIIMLRYFRDKTQKEVAEIIGVSQVQVSRLESKILNEIKSQLIV